MNTDKDLIISTIEEQNGITFEDFVISSHLRPTKELIDDIYNFIDK